MTLDVSKDEAADGSVLVQESRDQRSSSKAVWLPHLLRGRGETSRPVRNAASSAATWMMATAGIASTGVPPAATRAFLSSTVDLSSRSGVTADGHPVRLGGSPGKPSAGLMRSAVPTSAGTRDFGPSTRGRFSSEAVVTGGSNPGQSPPPHGASGVVSLSGQIVIDGREIGSIVAGHLFEESGQPSRGTTWFNPSTFPTFATTRVPR